MLFDRVPGCGTMIHNHCSGRSVITAGGEEPQAFSSVCVVGSVRELLPLICSGTMPEQYRGGRFGRAASALLALASALVLLGLAAVPSSPQNVAVLATTSGLRKDLQEVKAQEVLLSSGSTISSESELGAASPWYSPLGSLTAQANSGTDPARVELDAAKQELASSQRHALAIKLQAAQSRQDSLRLAEVERASRVKQWRMRQLEKRRKVEQQKELNAEQEARVIALKHAGELGSWLASADKLVPASNNNQMSWTSNPRRRGRRGTEVHGRQKVQGVSDLPHNWFMGGVALTGAAWRRRLGDSVVEANLRTRKRARKFQKLVSS